MARVFGCQSCVPCARIVARRSEAKNHSLCGMNRKSRLKALEFLYSPKIPDDPIFCLKTWLNHNTI